MPLPLRMKENSIVNLENPQTFQDPKMSKNITKQHKTLSEISSGLRLQILKYKLNKISVTVKVIFLLGNS